MNAVQFIAAKRDGQTHSAADIRDFVRAYTVGEIPDYQAAAWLMAVYLRGLSDLETIALTDAMTASGRVYSLGHFGPNSVDKHSTGGVGDKTTLIVAPLCAALGVRMPKMSGRGLGFTGGTLDKLEAIPGLRVQLTQGEFESIVERVGTAVCAQSADLVPADGKLYALRDVTATVESAALGAASIMSKKLAIGCPSLVLDVKVGNGAAVREIEGSTAFARLMMDIGRRAGRRVTAVLGSMAQPLGMAVGNTLEVLEAVECLRGAGPADLREHCLAIASEVLTLAGISASPEQGRPLCAAALDDGRGLAKLSEMVAAQGGDAAAVTEGRLPCAPVLRPVCADRSGYVVALATRAVGETARALGAGRTRKEAAIDHRTGILLHAKVGDLVAAGERLATVHAGSEVASEAAALALRAAYTIADDPVASPPTIFGVLRA